MLIYGGGGVLAYVLASLFMEAPDSLWAAVAQLGLIACVGLAVGIAISMIMER